MFRWVSVAAVLALAAGCADPGPATAPADTGSGTGGPTLVAWVDRPAPPYVEPTPTPLPTDAPPCRAADLSVAPGPRGVGLGNTDYRVTFTNAGAAPCVLLGYPDLAGVSADGEVTPLDASHGSYFGDPGPEADIDPGQAGAVNISGGDACPRAQREIHEVYPTLRVGLPAGGTLDVPGAGFDTVCGVSVSRFGVPADQQPPAEPPPSPLTATISAAPTVRAGADLSYTVALHNRTDADYPLRPCPAYEEVVAVAADVVARDYYLDCDAVQVIPAHATVTYEMRLQLPADLPPGGPAKFTWHLQGESGPWAGAPLEVTA